MKERCFRNFQIKSTGEVKTAVLATQSPVWMSDGKGGKVREVLLMSGCRIPNDRTISLLDNHNTKTLDGLRGSIHNVRVEGKELVGELNFSSTAERDKTLTEENHLRFMSAGYDRYKKVFIAEGKSRVFDNEKFDGPILITTDWEPSEGSLTTNPADHGAKIRCQVDNYDTENNLINRGNMDEAEKDVTTEVRSEVKPDHNVEDLVDKRVEERVAKFEADRVTRDKVTKKIRSLCDRLGVKDLSEEFDNYEAAAEACLEIRAKDQQKVQPHFSYGAADSDKRWDAIESGLRTRSLAFCNEINPEARSKAVTRVPGTEYFENASIADIARECLEMSGVRTQTIRTAEQLISTAMTMPRHGTRDGLGTDGAAYHTVGNFPALLENVLNKNLALAYTSVNANYKLCFRQGQSVPDFKQISTVLVSGAGELDAWDDNTDPLEKKISDSKEVYKVEKFANLYSFSYSTMIMDDLSGLSRVPASIGLTCQATINRKCFAELTDNAAMSDGVALFHSTHANYISSGAAPTTASLNTAMDYLAIQTDPSGIPQGYQAKFLVVPPSLRMSALQLCRSATDPSAELPAGVFNIGYGLTPIVEAMLHTNSDVAWYVIADPSSVDTIEYRFQTGHESPILNSWINPKTLALEYRVMQNVGYKAINWRGMVKNAGQ